MIRVTYESRELLRQEIDEVVVMDDYLVSACPDPLHCSGYYRGAMSYHHHRYALSVASRRNKWVGYKMYRVVMVKGHFVVVDRTWERNN